MRTSRWAWKIVLGVEKIVLFRRIAYPISGAIGALLIAYGYWKRLSGFLALARQPWVTLLFIPATGGGAVALAPYHRRIDWLWRSCNSRFLAWEVSRFYFRGGRTTMRQPCGGAKPLPSGDRREPSKTLSLP